MTPVIGSEGGFAEPLVALGVAALFVGGIWNGVKTWRGEVPARVARYEHQHGARPSILGSRREYQTYLGAGYLVVPGGIGALMGIADYLLRWAFSADDDWWVVWVLSGPGGVLGVASGVLLMAYYWVGLPDWLRPPCQRGWKMKKGELVLVRPERFHEHPKYKPPDLDERIEPERPMSTSEVAERLRLRQDDK